MTISRLETIVLLLAGLFFLLPGIWAFAAPHSFYDQLATFPPYNRHLLHDIGAFQIGIGAALLLALRWSDARFVVLAGAAPGAIVHFVSHIIDHDLGGKDSDVFVFGALAVLLLIAAALRWNGMQRGGSETRT
jgi:peptidoglycan/LPS O-acetylase OafA/YrhL